MSICDYDENRAWDKISYFQISLLICSEVDLENVILCRQPKWSENMLASS